MEPFCITCVVENLLGDTADIDAGAAEAPNFNKGDLGTIAGGAASGSQTSRPAANNNIVIREFLSSHTRWTAALGFSTPRCYVQGSKFSQYMTQSPINHQTNFGPQSRATRQLAERIEIEKPGYASARNQSMINNRNCMLTNL